MTHEDTGRMLAVACFSDAVRKNFNQRSFTRQSHEHWIRTHVETGMVQMIICDLEWDTPSDL